VNNQIANMFKIKNNLSLFDSLLIGIWSLGVNITLIANCIYAILAINEYKPFPKLMYDGIKFFWIPIFYWSLLLFTIWVLVTLIYVFKRPDPDTGRFRGSKKH